MRIGIDARFFGPDSKGLGRYTQKLILMMEKIDQENDYVIFLRKNNYDLYVPQNVRFKKVLADYRWYSFGEQFLFPFVLYRHHCDIVHFPHFNVPILYARKIVVTIHDLILLHFPTRKASTRTALFYWCKFLCYRLVIATAVRRAWKIIAVSHFTRNDICKHYPHICDKIMVIHEAAEIVARHVLHDEKIFIQYGIMKPYMLYVGNAYPHKNLHKLVDAFALYVKNGGAVRHMVLVGSDDYFYAKLKEHIADKDIKNIIILHTVDDVLLQSLYQHAIMFVFPSLYEGFGLPPLEAQLLKIPVLSSDHACMREILSEGGALYVDVTNIEHIARGMDELVSQPALRNELIVRGYRNAQKYSWRTMAELTHNIYIQK